MYKKFLAVLIFVMLTGPVFPAGSGGTGTGSGDGGKKNLELGERITQYQVGEKMINKAKKFEKKNKIDKAQKHYKKAIGYLLKHNKEFPADPNTLNYLGFAHRKIGDYENAEIYYKTGLEIEPHNDDILAYQGELYLETGRYEMALENLRVLTDICVYNCDEKAELSQAIAKYELENNL